jgi:hypothetical protein
VFATNWQFVLRLESLAAQLLLSKASDRLAEGWKMKMQNMIRAQVMMVGMAAALFVAGSAKAQEITNQEWPDSTVAAQAAPVAQRTAQNAAVAAPGTAQAAVAPSKPVATEAASMASLAPLSSNGRALAISLIAIIVGGVMYLRSKADAGRMVDAREVRVARSVAVR